MPEESTTADPVELTRQTYELATDRDHAGPIGFWAPGVVYDISDAGLGTFEGRDAVRGFFEDWWRSYAEVRLEVEEITDLGCGVVFAADRERVRLVRSEGRVEQRGALVSVWSNSKIDWFRPSSTSTRPVLPRNASHRSGGRRCQLTTSRFCADRSGARRHLRPGSVTLLGALPRVLDLSALKLCHQRRRCYGSYRRTRP